MSNSIYAIYHLDSEKTESIVISISIGKSQTGTTELILGNKSLGIEQGTFSKSLGSNSKLENEELNLQIVCTDVNPETNDLFATVSINGGLIERKWHLEMTVSKFGSYTFFGTIKFRG